MAMAVQGSGGQQQDHGGAGVRVKFIETQFISSDAASFKAVVQRLTGRSSSPPAAASPAAPVPPAAAAAPRRPRPCRPAAFAAGAGQQHHDQQRGGWAEQQQLQQQAGGGHLLHHTLAPKQEPHGAAPPSLDEMYELCDFSDLLYTTAGARRDGGAGGFPYRRSHAWTESSVVAGSVSFC